MTDSRGGYEARLQTAYMNTTGMCVELYFQARFNSMLDLSVVSIIVISENNTETLLARNNGLESPVWNRMFAILPAGIYQVVIEGRRSKVGLSSLSIDDVVIRQCNTFGKFYTCNIIIK